MKNKNLYPSRLNLPNIVQSKIRVRFFSPENSFLPLLKVREYWFHGFEGGFCWHSCKTELWYQKYLRKSVLAFLHHHHRKSDNFNPVLQKEWSECKVLSSLHIFSLVGIFFLPPSTPPGIPDSTGWRVLLINDIAMKVTGWELASLT